MYNRALNPENPNYIWLAHPDVSEQFDYLNFPIGTGGVPVYLPAAQQGAVTTLKGHSVITSDNCSAIGDVGDLSYVDLSQYMMIYKGGVQADTSMHVQFLTAENCFRFIFRANGMPKKNKALTIKNSSNTRSPFVTLAAR
jgi:HK97 family phage major capsid protein